MENKKLYVGNLAYTVTEDQLKEMFSGAGEVASAIVITDKFSGRSKGFGFVEMAKDEDAKKAVTMFDKKDLEGRAINVSEARPREERPARDFRR